MIKEETYDQISREELLLELQKLKDERNQRELLEESFNEIFNNSSELIYIHDEKGVFIDVNEAVLKKYGYTKKEIVGKTPEIFGAPGRNDLEYVTELIKRAWNGKNQLFLWWSITKDGTVFPKELSIKKGKYFGKDVLISTARDISETMDYEDKLIESERRYRELFERSLSGIYITTLSGEIVDCNQAFASILGFESKEELIGKINAADLYEDKLYRKKKVKTIVKNKVVISDRIRLIKKNGSPIWVLLSASLVKKADEKNVDFLQGTFIDITEQVKAEELLTESQKSYKSLLDTSPFGIILHDYGQIIFTNKKAKELMGISKDEKMKNRTVYDSVFDQDKNVVRDRILKTYEGKDLPFREYKLKRKDGREINVETKSNLIKFQGKKVIQLSFHDITNLKQLEKEKLRTQLVQEINESLTRELKEKTKIQKKLIASEEKLKTSLMEKEVLLKEVHHRVKNNLQVISSIFNLQKNYSSNSTVRDILIESQNRIKSMAFIHESLYKTVDFARINFSEYTENLCYNLLKSYNFYGKTADLELDLKEVFLNLDFAIPCGLIVNELITNAIKYAFVEKEDGIITVKTAVVRGKIKLIIQDNGVGLPKEINFRKSNSLGFQLVNALVEQINGKIKLKVDKGTKYEVSFSV